ncbi:hypothetical protein D9M71_698430 [compost metagenome]
MPGLDELRGIAATSDADIEDALVGLVAQRREENPRRPGHADVPRPLVLAMAIAVHERGIEGLAVRRRLHEIHCLLAH